MSTIPALGAGLGYRVEIHDEIVAHVTEIDWLEIIADQFMPLVGDNRNRLAEIRSLFPCVAHSLSLSIGGPDPLDTDYLDAVCAVGDFIEAPWMSDHFCFTQAAGVDLGHLAPIPWTKDLAGKAARKARAIQDRLGRPFLLENITYHFMLGQDMTEAQFISAVLENSGCSMLLDVSNIYTNSVNHGFSATEFLDEIPMERVVQMHLAGGHWVDGWLEDSHDALVPEQVWALAEHAAMRADLKGVLLEHDAEFPDEFSVLLDEVSRARGLATATARADLVAEGRS